MFLTLVFLNSMIIFLGTRGRHNRLDLSALSTFALVCIYTLIVESAYQTRAYVVILAVSTAAVRILVTKARRDDRPHDAGSEGGSP
jgi:uncharacterized membrane protein